MYIITLTLKCDAKYYVLADDDTLKAFELHLAREEADELYKILQNNKDPRWTQSVIYLADNFKADGKSVDGKVEADTEIDIWIKQ